jgi:GDP-mannose 4,6-dehydratase
MRTALITGIGGQGGSCLAEFLLKQGYAVHGLVRRSSNLNRERIDGLRGLAVERGMPFELHYGNRTDPLGLQAVIGRVQPDEIYNLASESHVGISFDEPEHSTSVNAVGVLRLLEVMLLTQPQCRFYQASTSELFGGVAIGLRQDHRGAEPSPGRRLVAVEPRFFRPLDHSSICGSAEKARALLGWEPTVGFDRLVEIMMEADLAQA